MAEELTKPGAEQPKRSKWHLRVCGTCGCLLVILICILFALRTFTSFSPSNIFGNKNSTKTTDEEDLEMTKDELINYFVGETTVWPGISQPMKLIKWKKEIVSVSIEDTPPEKGVEAVDKFIEKFNQNSSSVKLNRVSQGGDIKIYFQAISDNVAGRAGPSSGADYTIDHANVNLSSKAALSEQSLDQVLSHEMFHALGFYGHYLESECRLMSPSACGSHFTINEERLIQMLYATDIPDGSDEQRIRSYFQNWSPK